MSANPSVEDDALGRRTIRRVSYRILPFVALLYIFNYIDRTNIGYAQLGMKDELGISAASFGTAASIFFLAYVALEIPSNMVMKKVGARLWLARIAVTWGIVTVMTGFVHSITQLYIARILLGVAEAGLYPGLLLFLTFWYRGKELGRAIAALSLAQPIAMILGGLTGGFILDHAHWFGLNSWRWVFILQGAPAILMGVVVVRYLPNNPSRARFLTKEESGWLERQIDVNYQEDEEPDTFRGQLRVMKNRRVLWMAVANLFAACGLNGFTFFLPQIVKQLNPSHSSTNIGMLGAIPFAVGAVGMLWVAYNSDRTGERRFHVVGLMVLAAAGLFGTIEFHDKSIPALACLSLVAIGVLGYLAPYYSLVSRMLSKQQVAVGLAGINSIGAFGGFLGPYVIGHNASADNVTIGLYFPIVCLLLCALMLLFIKVPKEKWTPIRSDTAADRGPSSGSGI